MTKFWLLSEGADPARIGSGLHAQIADVSPEFEWVQAPRLLDGDRYLGMFRAASMARAQRIALLIAILGDALARVWPVEDGELHTDSGTAAA